MLQVLDEFRKLLDDTMLQAMHRRIVLYGYGYTGRFLKWYAEYYHNIKVDYIVSLDMGGSQAYDWEIFRPSLFNVNYKDVNNAVVWLAEPMDEALKQLMRGREYFDFYQTIYGKDISWDVRKEDIFLRGKDGKRDIQFLEWLEWKYQCNFVTAIESTNFEVAREHGNSYRVTTQKEIFPILDRCHCIPSAGDAIFDYGCGKGGALVSFLDYGFTRVGGVEYEPKIHTMLVDNMKKLKLYNENVELIQGDAAKVNTQLDKYNWFYFFYPFDNIIMKECIGAICESLKRCTRRIHIISIMPMSYSIIERTGYFRLTCQFTIDTRQRVVDVYESVY